MSWGLFSPAVTCLHNLHFVLLHTHTLQFLSLLPISTTLRGEGRRNLLLFGKRSETVTSPSRMEKNVQGFLLPSSDPLNFQYSRRLWKDSKSSGNRQKPGHPKGSWRSLTSPGFQPDLPWSSTTSCCCRALTPTPGEQSEILEPLESCKPECWHMGLLRLQREAGEELPWAEQGLLSRPSSHWGGLLWHLPPPQVCVCTWGQVYGLFPSPPAGKVQNPTCKSNGAGFAAVSELRHAL